MKPAHFLKRSRDKDSQLEQVVTIVEQCLEGPVTEKVIQEFTEQEALAKQQVEAA
jgi:hypothetical protein